MGEGSRVRPEGSQAQQTPVAEQPAGTHEAPAAAYQPQAALDVPTVLALQGTVGNAVVARLVEASRPNKMSAHAPAGASPPLAPATAGTLARFQWPWESGEEAPRVPPAQSGIGEAAKKAAEEAEKAMKREQLQPQVQILEGVKTELKKKKPNAKGALGHVRAVQGTLQGMGPPIEAMGAALSCGDAAALIETLDQTQQQVMTSVKEKWQRTRSQLDSARDEAEKAIADAKKDPDKPGEVTQEHFKQIVDLITHVDASLDSIPTDPHELNIDLYLPVESMLSRKIPGTPGLLVDVAERDFRDGLMKLTVAGDDAEQKKVNAASVLGIAIMNLRVEMGDELTGEVGPDGEPMYKPGGGQPAPTAPAPNPDGSTATQNPDGTPRQPGGQTPPKEELVVPPTGGI
jgi:hypothetical protein